MYCTTNQFTELQFCGPHNKPNVSPRLGESYHTNFDPKIGHGTRSINYNNCECYQCTYALEKPWDTDLPQQQQQLYQTVKDCTNWPVLGYFNNYNIIIFT